MDKIWRQWNNENHLEINQSEGQWNWWKDILKMIANHWNSSTIFEYKF